MNIAELKKEVENCLSDGRYDDLVTLVDSKEARPFLGKDQVLYIIGILVEIHKIEAQNGVTQTILIGRSIDEVVDVYKKLVLLLRRLEFNLEFEYQKELMPFIVENGISGIAVWAVVQGATYLYAKDQIIERFKALLKGE